LVIAGHVAAVERAVVLCKEAGAKRAMVLPVSAPFHSPLMAPAAEQFSAVLAGVTLTAPRIPVIQNHSLVSSSDPDQIRLALVRQIVSPVPWVATMQLFAAQQVVKIFEIGPGKVLAGLNKRIDASLDTLAVNDPASLAQALSLPATV
jgi:[acyl-carrier-protein] S-malonyltransferase